VSFHTRSGTPTARRSLLCTARMVLTKSALAFPVLLLCCDEDAFPGVGVVVGVGVALHVELSVPGPHPDVGV
jgi:hypothetical protein